MSTAPLFPPRQRPSLRFARATPRPPRAGAPSRTPVAAVALASAAALALFLCFRARAIVGDAAVYAGTIADARFFVRSIHFGYYVVGWIAQRLLSPWNVPLDQGVILLNAALTPAAVFLAWRFTRALGEPRRVAAAAALVLLFSGNVLAQGTNAEIYSLELVCVLASWTLFLRRRVVAAGLVFGYALLVTPLAACAAGLFLWEAWRTRRPRAAALTLGIAAAVLGVLLAFCWREYFFGTRGLFAIGPKRSFGFDTLAYNAVALVKNFHWALPFAGVGVVTLARARDARLGLLAVTMLFHLPVLLGMREDGVFLLSAYPVFVLAMVWGAFAVADALPTPGRRLLLGGLAAVYVATGAWVWLEAPTAVWREELIALARGARQGTAVVASWPYKVALEYYGRGAPAGARPELLESERLSAGQLRRALAQHPRVYLVEKFYPTRSVRSLFPAERLEQRRGAMSLLATVRRMVPGVEATPVMARQGGLRIYRLQIPPTDRTP